MPNPYRNADELLDQLQKDDEAQIEALRKFYAYEKSEEASETRRKVRIIHNFLTGFLFAPLAGGLAWLILKGHGDTLVLLALIIAAGFSIARIWRTK
jgi:hypothetical protein